MSGYSTNVSRLKVSNIGQTSATVNFILGDDEYKQVVQNRNPISIRYIQDSVTPFSSMAGSSLNYQVMPLSYSADIYNPLPVTLSNLLPNTTYRVWFGKVMIGGTAWSNKSYTFTTSGGGFISGGALSERLILGSRSFQVRILETYLAEQGFMPYAYVDEYFGTSTYAAVRSFQSAHGLSVDGRVGSMTRALLNQMMATR